jgi:hypothetical protein
LVTTVGQAVDRAVDTVPGALVDVIIHQMIGDRVVTDDVALVAIARRSTVADQSNSVDEVLSAAGSTRKDTT